jgi:cytochrome P450 family 4
MELCEIYGNDDPSSQMIKSEDLHRMQYLERVIKETLRLFPLGPMLIRHLSNDLQMGKNDYTLLFNN